MIKHQIINKETGAKGTIMVVSYDPDEECRVQSYSYDTIEDLKDEWALYEYDPTPSTLTITVQCESKEEADKLEGELRTAQAAFSIWEDKEWVSTINELKEGDK